MNKTDTIVFMSAYETTKYSKSRQIFRKTSTLSTLLDKHHLSYILKNNKLISSKGALELCAEYDYIQQSTAFSFSTINEKSDIDNFEELIKQTGSCIKLLHAQSVLSDPLYFNIDFIISMDQFLVYIGEQAFQIDPVIFSLNRALIIAFEVIDFETGNPLKKDDVLGKLGNYNLLTVNGYQYFGETSITPANNKISEIIYNNISSFFSEMTGKKFVPEDYSFIHNTLVLSNDVDDIAGYFCKLIGTKEIPSPLVNISTTENYQYYPQDGSCVITKYNSDDVSLPLYNGILFEAIKIYVYLTQIINLEITSDVNKVMHNDLYLENLFFAPHVPIETHNLLSYVYKTNSFQHHKEATRLKISYMTAENDSKKSRNGVLLNILLYSVPNAIQESNKNSLLFSCTDVPYDILIYVSKQTKKPNYFLPIMIVMFSIPTGLLAGLNSGVEKLIKKYIKYKIWFRLFSILLTIIPIYIFCSSIYPNGYYNDFTFMNIISGFFGTMLGISIAIFANTRKDSKPPSTDTL